MAETPAIERVPVEVTRENVHVALAARMAEKVAKWNKRLVKIGVDPAVLTHGEKVERVVKDPVTLWEDRWFEFEWVKITGEFARYAGWDAVATLDHTLAEDEALVTTFPRHRGEDAIEVPDHFRFRGSECDHCHISIRRNLTILFHHEDGRWAQVGTTCCRDFIGVDPGDI